MFIESKLFKFVNNTIYLPKHDNNTILYDIYLMNFNSGCISFLYNDISIDIGNENIKNVIIDYLNIKIFECDTNYLKMESYYEYNTYQYNEEILKLSSKRTELINNMLYLSNIIVKFKGNSENKQIICNYKIN